VYGRKWVVPQKPETWTPLFSLDFSVVGSGTMYTPKTTLAGVAAGTTGLAWQTYTMPRKGTFVSSWFHSHAQAPSDFWVLDVAAEAVVPQGVQQYCARGGGCGTTHGTTYGILPWAADIALEPLGTSAYEVQSNILATASEHVRCAYTSRNQHISGGEYDYGRSPLRAANGRCDDWTFEAGDKVTLIAFNWPSNLTEVSQHNRWFAVATFDGLDVTDLGQPPLRSPSA